MYKKVHHVHHSVDYRVMKYHHTHVSHFFETPFQILGLFIPFIVLKFDGLVPFIIAFVLITLRGLLRHHNSESICLMIGNHHVLHHQYPNCNYGEYYLDYLFNTEFETVIGQCKTSKYTPGYIYY